jgi:general secretion pathway protein L
MRLVVRIPERWENADCPVHWVIIADTDCAVAREGETPLSDLPQASRVEIILPAGRVFLTTVNLPARALRRMRHALAYAIEDQLTSDAESVHAVLGPAVGGGRRAIAAIDKFWLRNLIVALENAGVRPHALNVETCLLPRNADEWTVALEGSSGFVRTGDAAGMALDQVENPPPVLRLALEDARQAATVPQRIVIHAQPPFDPERWSSVLGVPCLAADPWRPWREPGPAVIDLLQGEFATASGLPKLWVRLRPAVILLALAMAIEVVGVFAHWGALRHEKYRLESQMEQTFRKAFPQAQAVVDPALQMSRNLEVVRAAGGIAQASDFLSLVGKAARHYPGTASPQLKAIAYDAGRLTLDVALADRRQAESLLRGFGADGLDASLEAVNPNGTGVEARFVLVARRTQ